MRENLEIEIEATRFSENNREDKRLVECMKIVESVQQLINPAWVSGAERTNEELDRMIFAIFSSRMHETISRPSGQISRDNIKLYQCHVLIMQACGPTSRNNIKLYVRRVFFISDRFCGLTPRRRTENPRSVAGSLGQDRAVQAR